MDNYQTLRLEPLYRQRLRAHGYQNDTAQLAVVAQLQGLFERLTSRQKVNSAMTSAMNSAKKSWLASLLPGHRHRNPHHASAAPPTQGLYLWGAVGSGKTYIADFLYEVLPAERKTRLHYYQFMQQIHGALKKIKNQKNPLDSVAERFAARTQLLFLDEFFVLDIGDAMLLHGLLKALFAQQIVLITTSNFAPQALYKDGLQRARFLPAIALLEKHTEVIELQTQRDYRTVHIDHCGIYHTPCDAKAEAAMRQFFGEMSGSAASTKAKLKINGRTIKARMHTPHIVWFDFKAICQTPRGASDYITLAQLYNTVLISKVPIFNNHDAAARRFIQLVDEFYDQNVVLALTAAALPQHLYQSGQLQFEFKRTLSRLREMQSCEYWSRAKT